MCSFSSCLNFASSAPQARSTSRTLGVSRIASSRCSTVRYSWRASRAWWNASLRQYSSSLDSTSAAPFSQIGAFHKRIRSAPGYTLCLLERTHQRMLVVARVGRHLRHLSFGDLICEDPAHTLTLGMYLEHDARRGRTVHGEELLQHVDHKLHGSVVIVQQHNPVQRRLFDLRPRLF